MKTWRMVMLSGVLMVAVAACSDDDTGITIEGAWARNSPATVGAGAGYLEITSPVADTLVGVAVDPRVAASTELHNVVMVESTETTMPGSMDMGGGMMMIRIEEIPLPAGETIALAPGGLHLMFVDLVAPLEIGQTFDITLQFESAADMVAQVEVREEAP